MMTFLEYIAETRDCLDQAQYLTETGRRRIASEILWLAVKQAINAIAVQTGEESGKYQHKRAIVSRLATEMAEPELVKSLRLAMQIHADADKGFMDPSELLDSQVRVRRFIELLLVIALEISRTPEQPN